MTEINGLMLKNMAISAAYNIANNKKMVDDLNVFPVPDGDTGTNMSMTSMAVAKELLATESTDMSELADIISGASLRGARGNSGVILSQLIRGFTRYIKGNNTLTTVHIAEAMGKASETAYKAVMRPTEGTMLTVARQAAEFAACECTETSDMIKFFEKVLAAAQKSLDTTPDLLPVLKQAGVVDAGGMGLVKIIEGALMALKDKPAQPSGGDNAEPSKPLARVVTDDIKFIYCTEFIIEKEKKNANISHFKKMIGNMGDCDLVIDDDEIVKVHVHTNNPGAVLTLALKIGELSAIKIDNMRLQHNETIAPAAEAAAPAANTPRPDVGIVTVASGEGLEQLFYDLGVNMVVRGGQSMNPSAEDILEACLKVRAKTTFILPNNKNIILAAEQVKKLTKDKIIVIPSKTIPQGISAVLALDAEKPPKEQEKVMTKAIKSVKTGQVTFASRSTEVNKRQINEGDILGLTEGDISAVGSDINAVAKEIVAEMNGKEKATIITVFYGSEVEEDKARLLESELSETYKDAEIILHGGGQPVYYYIISVE